MSLARAFTKRSKRTGDVPDPLPGRVVARPRKGSSSAINRQLISSPVELISTTNMLSYNAPDLPNPALSHISSSNSSFVSKKSAEDSDAVMSSPDLTDSSSVDSGSPTSPKPNHLSSYFAAATGMGPLSPPPRQPRKAASTTTLNTVAKPSDPMPSLPQRAISHSKQAHEHLARQRSMHSMNSRSSNGSHVSHNSHLSSRSLREQRSSTDIFRVVEEQSHPFGKELEQLNEVVEEFGGVLAEVEMDEDIIFMRSHGLAKFSVGDYLTEIQPLFGRSYIVPVNEAPAWI